VLKTNGLPMWVTIFALIVLVVGCALGLSAMFGPGMEGMERHMSVSWGGRHLGLGLAAGVAVLLKNPTAYLAAFIGGVAREIGDLIAELSKAAPSMGVVIGISVFLLAGILGIVASNKARKVEK
jgi:hypothetical protein